MIRAVADTHVVLWYLAADSRLSATAKNLMDSTATAGDEIAISGITLVEEVYLIEKGRIQPELFSALIAEFASNESIFVEVPVDLNIARADSY